MENRVFRSLMMFLYRENHAVLGLRFGMLCFLYLPDSSGLGPGMPAGLNGHFRSRTPAAAHWAACSATAHQNQRGGQTTQTQSRLVLRPPRPATQTTQTAQTRPPRPPRPRPRTPRPRPRPPRPRPRPRPGQPDRGQKLARLRRKKNGESIR